MDRQTVKPGWSLTVWALAGFLIVALAMYVFGSDTGSEMVDSQVSTVS